MESKCAAFWHHTNIRNDNRIFPCCRFKKSIATFNGNVSEILFYKEYEKLRDRSSSNDYIDECKKCYEEEKNGKPSLRQKFNKEYDFQSINLEFLEIGFDNICNLTCDGCWSEFSSAWSKKLNPDADKKIHIKSTTEIKEIPDSLKKVLFLGGEPLMTNRHLKFLKLIKNPNNVDVIYNTNGTFLLDDFNIKFLKEFKSVEFILSIDGYGKLNEKVRQGSDWNQILKFINQIKEHGFKLSINTVLHLNNWHGINELEYFISKLNDDLNQNYLTYPQHHDLNNLKEKQLLIKKLKSVQLIDLNFLIKRVETNDI